MMYEMNFSPIPFNQTWTSATKHDNKHGNKHCSKSSILLQLLMMCAFIMCDIVKYQVAHLKCNLICHLIKLHSFIDNNNIQNIQKPQDSEFVQATFKLGFLQFNPKNKSTQFVNIQSVEVNLMQQANQRHNALIDCQYSQLVFVLSSLVK